MPRRISLALALAFTTVVTFAIVAIGARAGVFSDSHTSKSTASAEEAPTSAPADAAPAPAGAPTSAAPQVIVETDYVDVPDAAPAAGAPASKPAATSTTSSAATGTAEATLTPRATATAQAAATATAPPQPTAATAPMPSEIEFVGTVTAISGNQVTFNHGGTLTTVQVPNPGALAVGVTAHVHALLTSSGYVATEVQAGG